ncbi:DUF2690 domain-containing protein [Streptomyces sp. NPDC017673]|uniref:DUF2690 domain-containing protein n=1 Tax=unclassified Streptomyces TaxID=2593676 RepID=UPI003799F2A1
MGELDWSYQVLQRNTGVSRSTWNRWYTHKKLPKREALVKFAEAAPRTVNRDELLGLWEAAWQAKQARVADRVPDGAGQADRDATATPATTSTAEQQASTATTSHTEPKKRSGKKTGRVLAGIMSAVILGGGAAVWGIKASADNSAKSPAESPSATPTTSVKASPLATCHSDSCTSVKPEDAVCSQDAITVYSGSKFGVTIELRYSPRCAAAWAKMSNTSPGDRVIITPKRGGSQEYRQQYGHDAHTRMVSVTRPEDARACAKVQDRGTVCAATSATSSPTPT